MGPLTIISIAVVVIIAGILVYLFFFKKNITPTTPDNKLSTTDKKSRSDLAEVNDSELSIQFEEVSALTEVEKASLVEIKDKGLLAKIDNVIPGAVQAAANAGAAKNYQQAAKEAGQLYRARIPKGARLVKARNTKDAVRGFYRDKKGIKGHAELVPVDGDMGKEMATMNVANAAMGVAAMVVGQYYMTQINDQLSEINQEIGKIASFQEDEYLGKILSIIVAIQSRSQFKLEIVDNENERNRVLDHLMTLEDECTKLLGQANSKLKRFENQEALDYSDYEKHIAEAEKWYQYQQVLLKLLLKIEELAYSLHLGEMSRDYCYSRFLPYSKQSDEALASLKAWHQKNGELYKIDLESSRRRRDGVTGLLMTVPALFKDDLHYKSISGSTVSMISDQSSGQNIIAPEDEPDLFKEDVQLIAKDGKIFYLPQNKPDDSNNVDEQ